MAINPNRKVEREKWEYYGRICRKMIHVGAIFLSCKLLGDFLMQDVRISIQGVLVFFDRVPPRIGTAECRPSAGEILCMNYNGNN